MFVRTVLSNGEHRCDSCLEVVPEGVRCRRIPSKPPAAKSKQQAMIQSRGGGKPFFLYRHVGCPVPALQVECPVCERQPLECCALPFRAKPDNKIVGYIREYPRPHFARIRKAARRKVP